MLRSDRARSSTVPDLAKIGGKDSESAACLDALVAKRVCVPDRVLDGKRLLERVYAMLTKLIERLEQAP